jgi:peptidoglycan/LPS O-acetylase OafA/YrhL
MGYFSGGWTPSVVAAPSRLQNLGQFPSIAALFWRIEGGSVRAAIQEIAAPLPVDQQLRNILAGKVISGLDAVRALAISLVLIDHFRLFDVLLHRRLPTGSMGVMIFFVLSGFLITSMLLKEYRKTGSISLGDFYRRRAFRIFPTFYVCWILTATIDLLARTFYWRSSIVSFFYLMDYGRGLSSNSSIDLLNMGISWSLAIEEKFYLLWPLLLLTLLRKRTTAVRALSLIIAGQWIYRAILYLGLHVSWNYFYNTFDMRVDALLIGCLLAMLLAEEKTRVLFTVFLRRQWLAAIPALALVVIVLVPVDARFPALLLWMAQPLIIAIFMVQFIYWGAKSWTFSSAWIVRFVAHISYALYLYHPLGGKIAYVLHIPHLGASAAVLAITLSVLSYYCIERPFMKMRDNKTRPAPAPAPASLTAS